MHRLAAETTLVLPLEVPRGTGMDLEDALAAPGTIVRGAIKGRPEISATGETSSLEEVPELAMAAGIAVAEVMIDRQYRSQQVELSELECRQIATLAVEVGGSHNLEIFIQSRFTAEAPKWGLRLGFAVDLSERKPYGPNKGEFWDLSSEADVKEP